MVYMKQIQNYIDETRDAVQEARIAGAETKISQMLGKMMSRHALVRPMVPEYLGGCVDGIYAEGLAELHGIAYDWKEKGVHIASDYLIDAILDVLNAHLDHMESKTETDAEA